MPYLLAFRDTLGYLLFALLSTPARYGAALRAHRWEAARWR
jgi:hypothetical protein